MSLIWIVSWLQCGSFWLISAVNICMYVCVVRSCQTRWFGETTPYIHIYDAHNIDEIIPHFLMSFLMCIVDMLDI